MILSFFTNRFDFFGLFEEQVSHAVEAARFFKDVVAQERVSEEMLSQMAQIEHQGDDVCLSSSCRTALRRRDSASKPYRRGQMWDRGARAGVAGRFGAPVKGNSCLTRAPYSRHWQTPGMVRAQKPVDRNYAAFFKR